MRVGFNAWVLANPEVRGLVRYTRELLRALSDREDVDLILFSPEKLNPAHLDGVRATTVVFAARRETVWVDWALPRKLREWEVDIFHAPADRGIPFLKPCPMVVTVHESYERIYWRKLFPRLKAAGWYWKYELANYWGADAVITVSDITKQRLLQLGVARRGRCHRLYLAPAREFSHEPKPNDAEIRDRYDIQPPYVLYVGGYDERKNVESLVRAFDHAQLPGYQLVIGAKKQWRFADLQREWEHLRCFKNLRLIEPAPDEIPALYRQADFFVNPSLWESFSLQLVEAMACGTPLLCSNRMALPEIGGDAASYFDPADTDELVQQLRRYAGDDKLKAHLRKRGFERVALFSWDAVAEQTVAIYSSLIEGGRDVAEPAKRLRMASERQRS